MAKHTNIATSKRSNNIKQKLTIGRIGENPQIFGEIEYTSMNLFFFQQRTNLEILKWPRIITVENPDEPWTAAVGTGSFL